MKIEKIVVIGGSGFVGREVCRLGRALGHEMLSISPDGRPALDEPWVEGVGWVIGEAAGFESWQQWLEGCYSVVVCEEAELEGQLVALLGAAAERAGARKFVLVSRANAAATLAQAAEVESDLLARAFTTTILRPAAIFGEGHPLDVLGQELTRALPVERVAMAALRAALEEAMQGILDNDAIDDYGDAMMIQ
ncbi:MAG: hypothetical protein H0U74_21320 [Bradymonadaceae bacterium]|nr:hypothetical protein [Lujinxingiaceae bacterium]